MEWPTLGTGCMQLIAPDQLSHTPPGSWNEQAQAYTRIAPSLIRNVVTEAQLLATDDYLFPITVNYGHEPRDNSYVVSPLTAYTDYATYELHQLGHHWWSPPLHGLIRSAGYWLERAQINRTVHVNNWLLSTNLYPPDWTGHDIGKMTDLLISEYPDHAVCFRSLNAYSNPQIMAQLQARHYLPVPSRQVYLFDATQGDQSSYLKRRDTRKDAKHLAHTGYTQIPGRDLTSADYARIETLYNLLYLEKYCPLNPQFSAQWLHAGQRDGWLELTALRSPEGSIDAVLGWVTNGHILSTPVVGYDTKLPQAMGLYRLVSQISLETVAQRRHVLNMSAGAAHFKRMRGGEPHIEYSWVYLRHLPPARQRAWKMLSYLLKRIGVPIMQTMKL